MIIQKSEESGLNETLATCADKVPKPGRKRKSNEAACYSNSREKRTTLKRVLSTSKATKLPASRWKKEKCIDCGSCTAVCFAGALTMNKETWNLEFDKSNCVVCELCIPACPLNLFEIDFR